MSEMRMSFSEKLFERALVSLADLTEKVVEYPPITDLILQMEPKVGKDLTRRNFGMYQQAYIDAIEKKNLDRFASMESLRILRPGIMSKETARQWINFGRQINPKANVMAFDIDKSRVDVSRVKGINLFQADALNLPIPEESMDLIITDGLLVSLQIGENKGSFSEKRAEKIKLIENFARGLTRGGVLLLEDSVLQLSQDILEPLMLKLGSDFEMEVFSNPERITDPRLYPNFDIKKRISRDKLKSMRSEAILRIRRVKSKNESVE